MNRERILYLGASGIMLSSDKYKLLIDALFCDEDFGDAKEVLDLIKEYAHPFDCSLILLFTHLHPDHFCFRYVIDAITTRNDIIFISNSSTVQAMMLYAMQTGASIPRNNIIELPDRIEEHGTIEIEDISIAYLNIQHQGEKFKDIQLTSFSICINKKNVVVANDANLDIATFKYFQKYFTIPDLAILPFYFAGTSRNQKIVSDYLRPRKIAFVHAPNNNTEDREINKLFNHVEFFFNNSKTLLSNSKLLKNSIEYVDY